MKSDGYCPYCHEKLDASVWEFFTHCEHCGHLVGLKETGWRWITTGPGLFFVLPGLFCGMLALHTLLSFLGIVTP